MLFRQIFDDQLAQYAYLVGCEETGEALLIDPERDVDRYVRRAEAEGLTITAVLETHIHADFLSGARELAERRSTNVYLSAEGGPEWQYTWPEKGEYDVEYLRDGDTVRVGRIELKALHTPGHTPEHLSFLITDWGSGATQPMGLISGDFVFVGDAGRPDLLETAAGHEGAMQEGAEALYHSVQDFLALEDYLQVWPGHGAGSACGKALGSVPETTVGYERRFSPALGAAQEGREHFLHYVFADQPEPPLYFARMKRLNREGPPLLRALPRPKPLSVEDLGALARRDDAQVLDTRPDRAAFMQGHLPGALYAPMNKTLPTIAGSYLDPDAPIFLIVNPNRIEDAVRCLVRVDLDDVRGFAAPEALSAYAAQGGALSAIERIDFGEMERRRTRDGAQVVDVRSRSEYEAGHIPDAYLAPHTRLPEHIDALPNNRTLLVHCGSGVRASSAASLLKHRDFNVVHVDGSFAHWSAAHADQIEKAAA